MSDVIVLHSINWYLHQLQSINRSYYFLKETLATVTEIVSKIKGKQNKKIDSIQAHGPTLHYHPRVFLMNCTSSHQMLHFSLQWD